MMGTVYPLGLNVPIEEKRAVVYAHYEKAYSCKLKGKLCDEDIQKLWSKLAVLKDETNDHFDKKPGLLDRYLQKNPTIDQLP